MLWFQSFNNVADKTASFCKISTTNEILIAKETTWQRIVLRWHLVCSLTKSSKSKVALRWDTSMPKLCKSSCWMTARTCQFSTKGELFHTVWSYNPIQKALALIRCTTARWKLTLLKLTILLQVILNLFKLIKIGKHMKNKKMWIHILFKSRMT